MYTHTCLFSISQLEYYTRIHQLYGVILTSHLECFSYIISNIICMS